MLAYNRALLRCKCWLVEAPNYTRKKTHVKYYPKLADLDSTAIEAALLELGPAPEWTAIVPDDVLESAEAAVGDSEDGEDGGPD